MENEIRSASIEPLHKPLGSSRTFPHFEGLLFSPVQFIRKPVADDVPVNIETRLGPHARRPLKLSMPIMVSAMGYGVALSKSFSLALAKGTALAGTAFNTGQGPVLREHRANAKLMVVQYHGAFWRPSVHQLEQADMIEIRFGQGANAGAGTTVKIADLPPDVLSDFLANTDGMGNTPTQELVIPAGIPEIRTQSDLRQLIHHLKVAGHGVPIGVKLAASNYLEVEMEMALRAGADVIVIDGAQAGTHGSPAILVDDFGLPTLAALCRADEYLRLNRRRDHVSLVISGRIRTPGDMLKALALGADAVYIASAALFATAHKQVLKPLPFEPPTQIAWVNGTHAKEFSLDEGANSLATFLKSSSEELKSGIRALGKRSLSEVDRTDLVAWDSEVARITGLPLI
ncbi:FMN-binding glutamate synthase family protein [Alicyclobacillus curvatus]|nr:FMN-binding glutamate synthase family protein [Alicyclobacillus curvatus]